MDENNNHADIDFVNEEEQHEQLAGYVEVDFVNEEAQNAQLGGDKEDLSRSVKELTVLVNNAVNEITIFKTIDANTDLVFSDGDYEYHADDVNKRIGQTINNLNMQIKQATPKPVLPDAWTNIQNLGKSSDLSNPMPFSNSNYRRDSKGGTMEEDFRALNGISKKLFNSPFSTPTTTAQGKKGSSSTKGKKTMFGSASVSAKRSRSVLPKGIKWNFPVTSDMKLDLAELQAIAYVYHPEKDKS
ncbi:hypothetical protein QL285_051696 [Trifolium repens]|nr:hypothetical protein QL285_051696 [Trifolium repens]